MPQSSSLRINVGLSTFASGYSNGELVADRVAALIPIEKRKATYFTRTRKDASTILDDEVGDTSEANEADYTVSSASATVKGRALKGYVSNVQIAEADAPNRPYEDKVDNLMLRLMLAREDRMATALQTAGNYAATAAATAVWTNHATSKPLKDITDAVSNIAPDASGKTKLVMVMSEQTYFALALHPEILGLRAGGGSTAGMAGEAEIATLLQRARISELVVSNAEKNTANRGQTATLSRIWDRTKVAIVRVPKNPMSAAATGYTSVFAATFRFNRPETGTGILVQDWEEVGRGESGSIGVKVAYAETIEVIQNDAGYLLTSVIA